MSKQAKHIRAITVSAILLAIALVLRTVLTIDIPLFGENGVRIGVSGIFSMMPSILFGPVYGCITGALGDLMGFVLKPTGAYMPLLTLTAALGGALRGALWLALRNRGTRGIRAGTLVFTLLMLSLGIGNAVSLKADGIDSGFYGSNEIYLANADAITPEVTEAITDGMGLIGRMLVQRTVTAKDPASGLTAYIVSMTYGLIGSGALGLVLLIVDFIVSRLAAGRAALPIAQLLIAALVTGMVTTTLNTVVLREMLFTSWKLLPFAVVWIPRAVEEVLANIVNVYFISLLYGVISRQRSLQSLLAGF
ncbi:MAG: folate family ECF transporter S component [Oscillospiraceae bacterium]|jgi:ECF transporter S component (folate family)|nr:folate family ECF transporter S component [Oscillospiraceae bacterium]